MKNKISELSKKNWFIALMCLMFFPVGLYLLWKSDVKKNFKILCSVLIGLLVFVSIGETSTVQEASDNINNKVSADKEIKEDVKTEPKEEPKKEEPKKELTAEEKAEIQKQQEKSSFLANLTELDKPKFELYGGGELNINFTLSDNITNKMTIAGFYLEVKNTCAKLKSNMTIDKYDSICFTAETGFVNSYGETSNGNAIIATISVEDIKRIQYDKITTDQFKSIITTDFVHPALKK